MISQHSASEKSMDIINQIHDQLAELRFLKESISDDQLTNLLVRRINKLEIDFNITADVLRDRDWDSDLEIESPHFCF